MDAPATVRVEELGSDASGYRDAIDERRRVLHVRGSTPRTTGVRVLLLTVALLVTLAASFAVTRIPIRSLPSGGDLLAMAVVSLADVLVGVAWLAVVPYAALQWAWRRLQWTRLEITRTAVIATTGPWGGRTTIEAWSARSLTAVSRHAYWGWPLVLFPTWDLYAERDDGRRVRVTTLFDRASVDFLTKRLASEHDDARPEHVRHPFAVRFGPMPEGVSCEGDPSDVRAPWRIEARCPRGHFGMEVFATCALAVFALASAAGTLAAGVTSIRAAIARPLPEAWLCAVFGTLFLVAVTVRTWTWLRDQIRTTRLRWRGRVHVRLDGTSVSVTTTPWAIPPVIARFDATYGPVALRVGERPGDLREAIVSVVRGDVTRVPAPMSLDDARYVATLVHAHQAMHAEQRGRT